MSIGADALAALRKDFAWSSAHDVCAELHIDPATHLDYPSRKFVFELLSDVNTSSTTAFGVDFQLHRWLINGRRFEVIMEMGAWDGTTTCGLFLATCPALARAFCIRQASVGKCLAESTASEML